ncbi:MAG: preprotein translocase subunit SecE [Desulfobacterales bacterium]
MGRLLRKKPIKKKRKQDGTLEDDAVMSTGAVSRTVGDASQVEKKPKSLETRKFPVAARPAPTKIKDNFITKSLQFLREVKMELKKVTWPSRKQTIGSTVVVLVLVTIIAFFLGAVDIGLSSLVKLVLQ